MSQLVVVARFSFPHEAHIARSMLESEGVPAFVADEHTVNMQWLYSNAIGGVRLLAPTEHAKRAIELLQQDHSDALCEVLAEEYPDTAEVCPDCGAIEIEPYTQGKKAAFVVFLLLGFPLFFYKHGLRCRRCGCFWRS
ncbi:DUF2007 domain-containing protein [Aliagarivorans taiwanensis]|uniref:putative signal transducing protein n=1 Tax=Aliagarivorans taiwanensis TaxID=561966 RepID=UPI000414C239|nr:DUF2007 domain-containing protein [Aliagarivorans taiwanensis]